MLTKKACEETLDTKKTREGVKFGAYSVPENSQMYYKYLGVTY